MFVTNSAGIVETAKGVKVSPSGEMSFASMASLAISSMKRFKATCSYNGLAQGMVEVRAGKRRMADLVVSLHTV